MGRVMTTGINIANKSSSSNALQSQDQPELDARYVYVGVHADGPTRVLCFGETRDEYTRGTNEESVALLTQRLKSLEERNKVDASKNTPNQHDAKPSELFTYLNRPGNGMLLQALITRVKKARGIALKHVY